MKEIALRYKWEIVLVLVAIVMLFTPLKNHLKRIFALATEIEVDAKGEPLSQQSLETVFTGINTANFNLSEHKNEVTFLHFWGTWCPDCVLELPEINTFYSENKGKLNIVLVAVEKDKTYKKLNNFLAKNSYKFPVYALETEASTQLHPNQFPTTIIIDKKGNILAKKVGATDWNSPEIKKQIHDLLK